MSVTEYSSIGDDCRHGVRPWLCEVCHPSEATQKIVVEERFIPKGAVLMEAYRTKRQIIVCGEPDSVDDHNCDQMGCTTVSHVIYRFNI